MTFSKVSSQVASPRGLEQHSCVQQELEIDGIFDKVFGTLYRVWLNHRFIGSFYQDLDGFWIVQPVFGVVNGRFSTDNQAILIILFATGNLVADVAMTV